MARPAKVGFPHVVLFAAAVASSWPARALAGEPPAPTHADKLFDEGRDAATRGDYAAACKAFDESLHYDYAVGTLINLGDCQEHLGHPAMALEYYEKAFARLSVTDDRMPLVQGRIDGLERRSARIEVRLGEGAPAETRITLDGEVLPPKKLATAQIVTAGNHVVIATAVGFRGSRQGISLREGEARTIKAWPGPPLETAVPTFVDTPPDTEAQRRESKARRMRVIGYTSVVVGVASLWVGSITGAFAIDRESLRRDNCSDSNVCNQTGYDAARSGSTFATVSTITIAAGALVTVAGIYLVLSNPPGPSSGPTRATGGATIVAPIAGGDTWGVGLRRSF